MHIKHKFVQLQFHYQLITQHNELSELNRRSNSYGTTR